jgi:ribosomal protein S6--L-glutamate ligase
MPKRISKKILIGRTEWCQFHELGIPAIKAKVDTGARTSAIHAVNIKPYHRNGNLYVSFDVTPIQGDDDTVVHCHRPVIDERMIMSSNGHKEHRYVIETPMSLGGETWDVELTLSNRDPLRYRMLLGIQAMDARLFIDPHLECNQGKVLRKTLAKYYS